MRRETINAALAEMARLKDAIETLHRMAGDQSHYSGFGGGPHGQYTAAVRRASMDLTRALARLRGA